ncbi:MAG TPA: DNA topoisomerase (ATP-hydrolyzing) subunit B [Candidatus Paceibacterota bacterium]|nr:DNA topoisomerase (ATP-hydrolyzing) subunit B [Candidatus Paceibacterota bacterium]
MAQEKDNYDASSIKVLEGLEGVRKRPAMYIGSTGKEGLHHLVYEIVDNSVDECLAGICSTIRVSLNKDGSVTVEDNGRGMPVDIHPIYKKPAMEIIVTKLHAGGKFDRKAYAVSGGLHGVGISVVAALSKKMTVEVKKDGKIHAQSYQIGNPLDSVKVIGSCEKALTGTKVTFLPDETIFSVTKFDFNTLMTRFREICFLNAGLKIIFTDENSDKKEEFHYAGGLIEFVKWLDRARNSLHKPVYFKKSAEDTVVEVSFEYNEGYTENIFGFVNTINTIEGGTHVSGFKTALTRAINDYATKKGILKNGEKLEGDDVREGLTAIISLRLKEPQFEGQTKTKLGNSEIKGLVDSVVSTALTEFFEENPSIASKIGQKASAALKARQAAQKAKELVRRKNALGMGGLPGKLADCSSKKREETELYLVEGESAGGTAKGARDKEFQAILPLRGKILNVEKSNSVKALSSEQIANLVTAIGTGVGEAFDIDKLRYHKIIVMADADVDGQHIKTLLLTFFYRYMPQLIESGHIFVAVAPLFKIRKGQQDYYVYSDEELKKTLDKLSGKNEVNRFKGLGEMNDEQLWDTTMNPKTRILKQVFVEDAIEADETFSILMGDSVEPRRRFIEENSKEAELDL